MSIITDQNAPAEGGVPQLPSALIQRVSEYGDARADDGDSAGRLGAAIAAIRAWGATLANVQPKGALDRAAHDNAIYERGRQDGIRQAQEIAAIQAPAPALPKKWTDEEIERGHVGIRWVTLDGVAGRPTTHDLREELARALLVESRVCDCNNCKAAQAPAVAHEALLALAREVGGGVVGESGIDAKALRMLADAAISKGTLLGHQKEAVASALQQYARLMRMADAALSKPPVQGSQS